MAIDESANLARERGSYKNFEGSRWSMGMVPLDTIEFVERERNMTIDLPKITKQKRLDWDALRAKVKGGMRNATLDGGGSERKHRAGCGHDSWH
jgi:ribonucleoside-diphosphate reductase alpha chain